MDSNSDTGPRRDAGRPPEPDNVSFAALRGRRVLLVDDNPFNRQLAIQLLDDVGVRVTPAENGRQALVALEADDFDVVLMDCRMPVMDGYEATRAIRSEPRWRGLPIIAMTASVLLDEHQAARAAGMDDQLVKPIDMGLLYRTLLRWIDHRAHHRTTVAQGGAAAATSLDDLPGIDSTLGLARAMNNEALFERLLRLFVRMHGNFGSAFDQMSAAGDEAGRRRLAHDLKSSAGTLGAIPLQQAATALEQACQGGAEAAEVQHRLTAVLRELAPVMAGIQALPPGNP